MNRQFALAAYEPDGKFVSGWGTSGNGRTMTDFKDGTDEWATAVDLNDDGSAVVVGCATIAGATRMALAKYDQNGLLVPTFGPSGSGLMVDSVEQSTADEANDVVIDGKSRIIVCGYSTFAGNEQFVVSRYLADGTLDASFGTNGRVFASGFVVGETRAVANAVGIDKLQNVVAAGEAMDLFSHQHFAVASWDDDGVPNVLFSQDGKVKTTFPDGVDAVAYDIGPTTDKRLAIAGSITELANPQFGFAWYDDNGNLDTTFSGHGTLVLPLTGTTESVAMSMYATKSSILAVGYAIVDDQAKFALARVAADGDLMTDFGGDGWLLTDDFDGSTDAVALSCAVRPYIGKSYLLAAGYAVVEGNDRFAVAQYDTTGKRDTNFGNNGKVTTTFPNTTHARILDAVYLPSSPSGHDILAVGWAG